MKKLMSLLVLIAHITSCASDQSINLAKDIKLAFQGQTQHGVNAQFHMAIVTGDLSVVQSMLADSTNVNILINGMNALPIEVALDQLVKTADTYNNTTAIQAIDIAGNFGNVTLMGTIISFITAWLALHREKDGTINAYSAKNATAVNIMTLSCYLGITSLLLFTPKLIGMMLNPERDIRDYWNSLADRFAITRILLNHSTIDLTAAKFNTPATQAALTFIRTMPQDNATYRLFVADVKAGKYESLRLCNKA